MSAAVEGQEQKAPVSPRVHAGSTTADLSLKLAELATRDKKLAEIASPPRSKEEPYPTWLQGIVPTVPEPILEGFDPSSSPELIKKKLVELATRDPKLAAVVTELPGHSTPLAARQEQLAAAQKSPAVSPPHQRLGHDSSPSTVAPSGDRSTAQLGTSTPESAKRGARSSKGDSKHRRPSRSPASTSSSSSSSSGRSKRASGIEALREKAARLRSEKAGAATQSAQPSPQVLRRPEPEPEPEPEPPSVALETVDVLRRVSLAAATVPLAPVVTPGDERVDRLLAGKGEAFEEIPLDGRAVVAGGRAVQVGTRGQTVAVPRQQEPQPQPLQQLQQRPQLSPRAGAMALNGGSGGATHDSAAMVGEDHPARSESNTAELTAPPATARTGAQAGRHPYLEQYRANAAKHAGAGSLAVSAAGRPTLRSTSGGRRVASALRVTALAATNGSSTMATGEQGAGVAVVNTILNQKRTSAAAASAMGATGADKLDKRTPGMATKVRAKAVAHMAGRDLQQQQWRQQGGDSGGERRKVVRFASKDKQQHKADHLRSVPAKVRALQRFVFVSGF
jgi:hypothetical protein